MAQLLQKDSAVEIHITGIVQGVGFRPHVYKLATSKGLNGWVINTTAGVTIRLEGQAQSIDAFVYELRQSPPPLARIETFSISDVTPEGFSAFFIHESKHVPDTEISIPPDVGTCPDCLREYRDANDRRHGYEFTNCVNCGPRFSITRSAPYDRENTSMHVFEMCEDCAREYIDPLDRRFHAEPNACPVCGPQILVTTPDGRPVEGDIRALLKQGYILAIKGIGGYHLACDASNERTVERMRERKKREAKPFALMCRDLETVRLHCELSREEEGILTSPARPILLLKRTSSSELCDAVAPGLDTLGMMLPYTPLHYGLFDDDLSVLVMTSANMSGDPLILTEDEAYSELGDLADYFVVHKREIVNRADDSVVMLFNGAEYFIRRARGYVPQGIKLPLSVPPILAIGGDLKSAFAYARDNKAILSQYFGDLDNLKNFETYEKGLRFFGDFLRISPEAVVCDLHPAYVGTGYAERYAGELGVPLIKVQHHKAHFASIMADAALNEKVLGVVCDGTGYGEDGSIWGSEFFYGDYADIERVGTLSPFPQPRGDSVAKYPLHMATVLLYSLWQDEEKVLRALPESEEILPFAKAQASSKTLSIPSSSCGRLFDAAAALCGFTTKSSYEGEAPMRMEAMASRVRGVESYRYHINESAADVNGNDEQMLHLSWDFIAEMAEDKLNKADTPEERVVRAARFHETMTVAFISMIEKLANRYRIEKVVFSGGTFQNRLIIDELAARLATSGIEPYFHRQAPANDGGLALGQVMIASRLVNR